MLKMWGSYFQGHQILDKEIVKSCGNFLLFFNSAITIVIFFLFLQCLVSNMYYLYYLQRWSTRTLLMNSVDLRVDKRLCTKTRRTANQIISTNEIY